MDPDTAVVRVELQCNVPQGTAWTAVEEAISKIAGTKVLRVDPDSQCLSIELSGTSSAGIDELQNVIESSAGYKTVLKGLGTVAAAVSEIRGQDDIVGVVRMAQLPDRRCFVDGVIDNIPNQSLSLNLHEFGDLSGSHYENVGKPILNVKHDLKHTSPGYSSFRLSLSDCDVNSCIGRAMAVSCVPDSRIVAAGIVARASTVGHNLEKKVCDCSGKSMWQERTENQMQVGLRIPVVIHEEDFQAHAAPDTRSRMDVLLETKWIAAQSLGVFKYNVSQDSLTMRTIAGQFAFVVQLNPDRGTQRRRPQEACQLVMPFDETLFNFTKTKESETLIRVQLPASMHVSHASLLINNSPIEYCSSLLVPDPSKKLPQVLTAESLLHAVSFLAASSCQDLRLGFNSLGAAASVNHLHFHVYRLKARLAIEQHPVSDEHVLIDWPIPGFAFDVSNFTFHILQQLVTKVMHYVAVCVDLGLAHNLFLTRTRDGRSIRIIVWPRKAEFGCKNDMALVAAFCEFSGFFIAKTKDCFDELSEEKCIQLLASVATEIDVILRHVRTRHCSRSQ